MTSYDSIALCLMAFSASIASLWLWCLKCSLVCVCYGPRAISSTEQRVRSPFNTGDRPWGATVCAWAVQFFFYLFICLFFLLLYYLIILSSLSILDIHWAKKKKKLKRWGSLGYSIIKKKTKKKKRKPKSSAPSWRKSGTTEELGARNWI